MLLKIEVMYSHIPPRLTIHALPLVLTFAGCERDKLRVRSEQFGTITDYCDVLGA